MRPTCWACSICGPPATIRTRCRPSSRSSMAQEKKKPGTMARIFSTHPMVGDRIEKVNALIARFPERSEYTINTSEFQQVKGRLIAFTNARATGGRGGASEADSKRPTLKKRQPGAPKARTPTPPAAKDRRRRPSARHCDAKMARSLQRPNLHPSQRTKSVCCDNHRKMGAL